MAGFEAILNSSSIDQAIQKAERLNELLDELKSRLFELSEMPTVGMVYVGVIDKGVTGVDRTVKVEWPVPQIRETRVDAGGACGSRAE